MGYHRIWVHTLRVVFIDIDSEKCATLTKSERGVRLVSRCDAYDNPKRDIRIFCGPKNGHLRLPTRHDPIKQVRIICTFVVNLVSVRKYVKY